MGDSGKNGWKMEKEWVNKENNGWKNGWENWGKMGEKYGCKRKKWWKNKKCLKNMSGKEKNGEKE